MQRVVCLLIEKQVCSGGLGKSAAVGPWESIQNSLAPYFHKKVQGTDRVMVHSVSADQANAERARTHTH